MKTKPCSTSSSTLTCSSSFMLATAAAQTSASRSKPEAFIGIDYHKRYSVYHVLDPEGQDLAKGRLNHTHESARKGPAKGARIRILTKSATLKDDIGLRPRGWANPSEGVSPESGDGKWRRFSNLFLLS